MSVVVQQKQVRKRLNWKRFAIFTLCSILFLLLMLGAGFLTVWLSTINNDNPGNIASGEEPLPPKIHERLNVLALGVDAGVIEGTNMKGPARTDTMMVLSFDPETNEGGLISIPRDTRVNIPGRGIGKVNAAHVYGGPELAIRTVEELLGIEIHYYVKVNLEGFEKIVDALGGVVIDVEKDMDYWDPTQNLQIHLQAGPQQRLNGSDALDYVRWRDDGGGDIGRIPRQQKFIRALADELMQMKTILKIPELVGIFKDNVETDMDVIKMLQYAQMAWDIKLESLEMETLAGIDQYVDGVSYWLVDEKGMEEQVDRILRGIKKEENREIKVQVLNGSGVSGAASELASDLRRFGFNVVAVGNAEHYDYAESLIICHNDIKAAQKVARAVEIYHISDDTTGVAVAAEEEVDVTIIVGQNKLD
ncbi:MAG: LCP family protein [bacterium]|jgi:LCP family protein required for cell wall assembly